MRIGRWGGSFRQAGWGVSDQAFSSLTNFALGLFVARAIGPAGFGAFGIAFATYVVALSVEQTLAGEPLMVRYSGAPVAAQRRGARSASGTALAIGVIGGMVCAVVAWSAEGALGEAFLALALTLPGLLLQDCWRLVFFASGRGRHAFFNDLAWAAVMFPALAVIVGSHGSVFWMTLAWGGAANVAAVVGFFQARLIPRPARTVSWLREHRDIAPRFFTEMMALTGSRQLAVYGIGAVASLAVVGAVRAGQLLLNPLHILSIGIRLVAIPEGVRIVKRSTRRLRHFCLAIAGGMSAAALLWGGALLLVPPHWGRAILGANWEPARLILLPLALTQATSGVISAATTGLRSLVAAKRSLRARLVVSGLQVAGAVGGAALGGAVGAAWGMAAAGVLAAVMFWHELTQAIREHDARRPPGAEVGVGLRDPAGTPAGAMTSLPGGPA